MVCTRKSVLTALSIQRKTPRKSINLPSKLLYHSFNMKSIDPPKSSCLLPFLRIGNKNLKSNYSAYSYAFYIVKI